MFPISRNVHRGTSLSAKAAFAVTPLFLFCLAVAANGDEPAATKPGHAPSAAARAMEIFDQFWTKAEAKEAADQRIVLLQTTSKGAQGPPGSPQAQGEPGLNPPPVAPGIPHAQGKRNSNRRRAQKATEAREIADEYKAVLESVNEGAPPPGAPGTPQTNTKEALGRPATTVAPHVTPHHYSVTLTLRECVDGQTYVTSLSLPVHATDGKAEVQVNSGRSRLSATAQLTGESGSETAQFVVSRGRGLNFPTITVAMGQIGRMQSGDLRNGFTMDVTLNRE